MVEAAGRPNKVGTAPSKAEPDADAARDALERAVRAAPTAGVAGLSAVLEAAAASLGRTTSPGGGPALRLMRVPPGAMATVGFADRARALAPEPGVLVIRPGEGRGAARYELATGHRLSRPHPADRAFDFLDADDGRRIALKGPVPQIGEVTDASVDGLARSTVREARLPRGGDVVVVDALGLSDAQVARLGAAIALGVLDGKPVEILR